MVKLEREELSDFLLQAYRQCAMCWVSNSFHLNKCLDPSKFYWKPGSTYNMGFFLQKDLVEIPCTINRWFPSILALKTSHMNPQSDWAN
jgi:hypothetical protein